MLGSYNKVNFHGPKTGKEKEIEEKSNAKNKKETQKQKNVDIERNLNL